MNIDTLFALDEHLNNPNNPFLLKLLEHPEVLPIATAIQKALLNHPEACLDVEAHLKSKRLLPDNFYTVLNVLQKEAQTTLVVHQRHHPDTPLHFTGEHFAQAKLRSLIGCALASLKHVQTPRYDLETSLWWRSSTGEWVLEISGSINDTSFSCRHTQPGYLLPQDIPSLPELYANRN